MKVPLMDSDSVTYWIQWKFTNSLCSGWSDFQGPFCTQEEAEKKFDEIKTNNSLFREKRLVKRTETNEVLIETPNPTQ